MMPTRRSPPAKLGDANADLIPPAPANDSCGRCSTCCTPARWTASTGLSLRTSWTMAPSWMPTMHLYREQDGRLREHWGGRDELAVLWQVGALTPPENLLAPPVRETRRRVLIAAQQLLLRRGYAGTTIATIARHAHVSGQTCLQRRGRQAPGPQRRVRHHAGRRLPAGADDRPATPARAALTVPDGERCLELYAACPGRSTGAWPPGSRTLRRRRRRPADRHGGRHHRHRACPRHPQHRLPRRRPLRSSARPGPA